jgi:tetratricopeptide (TPR) repeat protein
MNDTPLYRWLRTGVALFMTLLTASTATAQTGDTLDAIDAWFLSLRDAKKSSTAATLQTWVRAQSSFRDLNRIASDPATDAAMAWRARYVAAYGYWMIELFDIAAAIDREIAATAADTKQRVLALKDLAQALENAGQFDASTAESERLIAASEQPGVRELNNHALRLLKAGRYDECLAYVNRITLDASVAHTRIFSARAHAYRGRYDEAKAELRSACDLGEGAACSMLEALAESTPEKYWKEDREFRRVAWTPYNRLDSSIALAARSEEVTRRGELSWFATAFWFNEIHGLYPSLEAGEEIRPKYPAPLPKGRVGIGVLDGVPYLMARFDPVKDENALDKAVAAYVASIHGPSAWDDKEVKIRTRALVAPLPKNQGGGHVMIVVHTDWQEQAVRASNAKARWRVIATS